MPKRYTNDYFYEQMKILHPDIVIKGIYINSNTMMECEHVCGHKRSTTSGSLLHGHGCPKCNNSIKQSQEEFEQKVYKQNPNITIIGKYINSATKVMVKCNKDNYEWPASPLNLERGSGCPVCDNKVIIPGINDVATQRPDLVKYFTNPDETKLYSSGSHKHIKARCPDCGAVRDIEIKSLAMQGFSCYVCSDGISLPNKIASGLLMQLPVQNWIREYHPDWSNGQFYDNYFEYNGLHYILEMDGAFHFKDNQMNGQTKDDSQLIDSIKDRLASEHNIRIIRVECKDSSFDYVVQRIKESDLSKIFNLENIDWNLCYKYTETNLIKEICIYFQKNKYLESSSNIAKKFHISSSTFVRYKKIGVKVGWCTDTKEERKKAFSELNNNPKSQKVKVFKDGKFIGEFKSLNKCANELTEKLKTKFYGSSIAKAINNNRNYKNYEFQFA